MVKMKLQRKIAALAIVVAASLVATSCSSSSDEASSDMPKVTLIVKDQINAFFIAMVKGAKAKAAEVGVDLTVISAKQEGDDASQITGIENAISAKHAGILITPMSVNVNSAITKARDAGLFVISLDTPTDPADIVDITFATDNCEAGRLIGQWAAAKLAGKKAVIGLIDLFDDRMVSVDYCRDNGFLAGMGIDVKNPKIMGDEAKKGKYSGGDYEIVGNGAGKGAESESRSVMERLLSKNKNINVVYTINEPTAFGACAALKAAGLKALVVSVDGGRAGIEGIKSGCIGATSQQYPLLMADLGVQAIFDIVKSGTKPENSAGLDFFNTGVKLITDDPQEGVSSESTQYGLDNAWG
jgi:fructose transport system substrate-binding protein